MDANVREVFISEIGLSPEARGRFKAWGARIPECELLALGDELCRVIRRGKVSAEKVRTFFVNPEMDDWLRLVSQGADRGMLPRSRAELARLILNETVL